MQSKPNATTQSAIRNTAQQDIHREHGQPSYDAPGSSPPAEDPGAESQPSDTSPVRDSGLQHPAEEASFVERRVNPRDTPSPQGRSNRITEYEQASTPPVRKREGPGFEVIKRQRSPDDLRSPIQELPNEVLTHVLARLSPTDLTSVAAVSKRFHELVTGPHAWRSAFTHFFPGPGQVDGTARSSDEDQDVVRSEKRAFTRLTALASWRSEYIMRTRLLRSLGRGKPVQASTGTTSARSGQNNTPAPIIMYNSQLYTTINHLHATFGSGLNKRLPRFIHGADDLGTATSSDPTAGKVDHWGLSDPQIFLQFAERFTGDTPYGLGPGEVVGVPNVMDVSQPYGMVHGEGMPGGMTYYRSTEEMRGRLLLFSSAMSAPELGIPRISSTSEAITSVWIAKSAAIPSLTDGLVGILSASSLGVLTAYSLGSNGVTNNRDHRFGRGEMTARWALSPGVPIVAIAVDNEYSLKRYTQNRIWAVVLNALGEIFYLTKFPQRSHTDRTTRLNDEMLEQTAWTTGRSVYWMQVEPSRRQAIANPYGDPNVDGSYSPRSSWNGMCLSQGQIQSETREIEAFAMRRPKDFRKACKGWDMRRKLEIDFAADDGNNAGEGVLVVSCGQEEDDDASVVRYTRRRFQERAATGTASTPPLSTGSTSVSSPPSLFGASASPLSTPSTASFDKLEATFDREDFAGSITPRPMIEEWRTSTFSFGDAKQVEILATTIDVSTFATLTITEDPLLSMSSRSATSSPGQTPMSPNEHIIDASDVPGQRARLFAVGTKTGSVIVWDMRAAVPKAAEVVSTVEPVRTIFTDSPQISCLAISSLYLVHGGNDGLVQAWDPLGSSDSPIRTLNSRFSSRARRRLAQAQASPQGVGINLFAAGAICLDPDPTTLRGLCSLGTHLRYWSYSSSAADQYKSQKRRMRRSERGSNNGGERFAGVTRGNLKDYIANEKFELDREKTQRRKNAQRFAGRFGTELLDGASESEMIAYAAMLSQEALEGDNLRRGSDASTVTSSAAHSTLPTSTTTPVASSPPLSRTPPEADDEDMAEAIRLSLASSPVGPNYVVRQGKHKARKGSSTRSSPHLSPILATSSTSMEMTDLDFAIQLSLAEEQSKREQVEAFPALASADVGVTGKGKGKAS